ncbi:dihydrofolate synthase [Serratia symbiotica str. 'Cinara cedri']|nr:dihydrofolate synthase [Serratia symbiotica str. 'Cinara cedri']
MAQHNSIPQTTSSLSEWLHYLENMHSQSMKLGLERMRCVAYRLKLLHPAATVFTVAGTNGKGTTCCMLEAILLAAGLRVGVYSSPHLLRYTERVRIQGKEPKDIEFIHSFDTIENNRGKTLLTYFEFSTLSALQLFKQAQLDVVILEVGLGGRLDATNVITPSIAIITNIALDHTYWLGNDRESIGKEKAGIFRSNKLAVVGEMYIPISIQLIAEKLKTSLHCLGTSWNYSELGEHWQWQNNEMVLANLPIPNIPLVNAATALAALIYSSIDVPHKAIERGLQTAMLPGRFQVVCQEPRLILDVAHNPHAANYLATCLAKLPRNGGKVRAVVAMLSDKNISDTLTALEKQVDEWYCATIHEPRGAQSELLAQHLTQPRQFVNIKDAWCQAMWDANKQDIIIVYGSFYAVAHVMIALKENEVNK